MESTLKVTITEQKMLNDDSEYEENISSSYTGKDGVTVWKKVKPGFNVKTLSHNIVTQPSDNKGIA